MPLVNNFNPEFSKRCAAWRRLEPRCRQDDFSHGLQACTADPLWMLGRQWQTGERAAEDAGSPIDVTVDYSTVTPTQLLREGDAKAVDASSTSFEMLVEQEHLSLSWRDRVQIGQRFERLIRQYADDAAPLIEAYRAHLDYGLEMPPEGEAWTNTDYATRRFLKLACGRSIDGQKLLDKYTSFDAETPTHQIAPLVSLSPATLTDIVTHLRDWCLALGLRPAPKASSAWRNPHLDYRFELSTAGPAPTSLLATDYRGEIDWHSFNLHLNPRTAWPTATSVTTQPSPASVGGSSSRWWAFEDSATDFGSIEAGSTDLARLFLMEYVLLHGDEWYCVALPICMPALVRIDAVKVRNVFGDVTVVEPARQLSNDPLKCFDLFSHSAVGDKSQLIENLKGSSDAAGGKSLLFIPSLSAHRMESAPLEEAEFMRDEGANKVWAVEHRVLNGLGRAVDASSALHERSQRLDIEPASPDETANSGLAHYRLATTVPENWFPFAPFNAATGGKRRVVLRRAVLLRDASHSVIWPMSQLLAMNGMPLLWMEEAVVPRSGARVQITSQRQRWADGRTYGWMGRRVLIGTGEGSSGLRWDDCAGDSDVGRQRTESGIG